MSHINWKGDALKAKIRAAAAGGINDVMAECVMGAKENHGGWQSRTFTAERSVRVLGPAQAAMGARIVGKWGSVGTNYVRVLEFKHGAFLRTEADATYPKLKAAIRERMA